MVCLTVGLAWTWNSPKTLSKTNPIFCPSADWRRFQSVHLTKTLKTSN
jgi:hypothetical protein